MRVSGKGRSEVAYSIIFRNLFLQNSLGIVIGLPGVDRERLPELHGLPKLSGEDVSLDVSRGVVVVVV